MSIKVQFLLCCVHYKKSILFLQADLQTAAQRLPLIKKNKVLYAQIEPQQSIDDILSHEITEIGTHMYCFFLIVVYTFYIETIFQFSL